MAKIRRKYSRWAQEDPHARVMDRDLIGEEAAPEGIDQHVLLLDSRQFNFHFLELSSEFQKFVSRKLSLL